MGDAQSRLSKTTRRFRSQLGISFAQGNVKVEVVGGETMAEDTRNAAVAAAQDAIEQQVGEPAAAIPDEP